MIDIETRSEEEVEPQQHGTLTEASIPYLLPQSEEFVLYPP
jgi:hypothetical protein